MNFVLTISPALLLATATPVNLTPLPLADPWLGLQAQVDSDTWVSISIASIDLGELTGRALQLIALADDPNAAFITLPPRFEASPINATNKTQVELTWTGKPASIDPDLPQDSITAAIHIFQDPAQVYDPVEPRTGLRPLILEPLSTRTPVSAYQSWAGDAVVFTKPDGQPTKSGPIEPLPDKTYVLCDGDVPGQGKGWLGVIDSATVAKTLPRHCIVTQLRLQIVLLSIS